MVGTEFLPHPAQPRAGSASLRARHTAWIISTAGAIVFMVIGAGGRGFTNVPSGAIMSTARNVPSLPGNVGDKNDATVHFVVELVDVVLQLQFADVIEKSP